MAWVMPWMPTLLQLLPFFHNFLWPVEATWVPLASLEIHILPTTKASHCPSPAGEVAGDRCLV